MRTTLRIVLAVLAAIVLIPGIGMTVAWWTAGTPQNASSTIVTLAQSEGGSQLVGGFVVDKLAEDADPLLKALIESQRDTLVPLAAIGVRKVAQFVGAGVSVAFAAVTDGVSTKIDLTPVVNAALGEIHKVVDLIPAQLPPGDTVVIDINGAELAPVSTGVRALSFWWAILLVGVGLLIAAAFVGLFGGLRRWRVSGLTLAIVGVLWLIIGIVAPGVVSGFADDPLQQELIRTVSAQVAVKIMIVSGIALAVGLILTILSFIRRKAPAGSVVA